MTGTGHREFTFGNCLGKGDFGEVYLGTMKTTGGLSTRVAIKLLLAGLGEGAQAVERLRDEAGMLATVEHPAVLRVVDVTQLEGRIALITEYVEGQDLDGCFDADIPPRALLKVVREAGDALATAWSQLKIVHRDIKPANIRIGRRGNVKLLDFGIATTGEMVRSAKTQTGMVMGTPGFMPPERFHEPGDNPLGDVWALGASMYRGLTGQPFYSKRASIQMLVLLAATPEKYDAHLEKQLESLPEHLALTRNLLLDCLAFDPKERPPADTLRTRCDSLIDELSGPSLAAWCNDREWPAPSETGPLTGRTLSEGFTIQTSAIGVPLVEEPKPRTGAWLAAGGLAAVVGAGAVVVVVAGLGVAAVAGLNLTSEPAPNPAAAAAPTHVETEAPTPVEAEEREEVVEPEPAAEPEPLIAPASPRPALQASALEPPREEPAAEPAMGVVLVSGGSAELRADGKVFSPGLLPMGSYSVWADFGDGLEEAGQVEVSAADVQLHCNPLLRRCERP